MILEMYIKKLEEAIENIREREVMPFSRDDLPM